MKRHELGRLVYLTFEGLDPSEVFHAIFTRRGGHSLGAYDSFNLGGTCGDDPIAVKANHDLLFNAIGREPTSRYDVWQVHGKTIHFSDEPRPPEQKHQPADGIFTQNPDVTLMMRFADCVPLVYYDPVQRAVGLVHAGWQGTLINIAGEAVARMQKTLGTKPEDLFVGIGPSICGDCYEVREDVRSQFRRAWGEESEPFFHVKAERMTLDLWQANEYFLQKAGVKNIERSEVCTAENLQDWYSYRQEKGHTGRFAVVIALTENAPNTRE